MRHPSRPWLAALLCLGLLGAQPRGKVAPARRPAAEDPSQAAQAFAQRGMDKFFQGDLEGAVADWGAARSGSGTDGGLVRLELLGLRVLIKEELLNDDFLRAGMHARQGQRLDAGDPELRELEALATKAETLIGEKGRWARKRLDPEPDRAALISAAMTFDLKPVPKRRKPRRMGAPELRDLVARALAPEIDLPPEPSRPKPKPELAELHFEPPESGEEADEEEPAPTAEEPAPAPPSEPAPYGEGRPLQRTTGAVATAEQDTRRGLELYYRGDYKGALSCFHSALSRDLESKSAQSSFVMAMSAWNNKRAEYHYQTALKAYYRGDLEGAAKYFRQALQFNPKLEQAHKGLRMLTKS